MESESRFRTLADGAPIGIALVNTDNTATYINAQFTRIFGYTREDLQREGPHWYELAYPDPKDRKIALDALILAQDTQGVTKHTFRVSCKNRQYKMVCFHSTPLNDGRILLACEDVTEQRKIQDALRDSEEQLRLALECGDIALIDYDFSRESIYVSPQYLRQLGYSPNEMNITGESWPTLIHPGDRSRVEKTLEQYLATGGKGYYEMIYRMKTKDGSIKWILDRGGIVRRDPQGKPSRMIGVHIDITARKQAEEALRKSEQQMADIIDFLPDATFAIDREGKVIAWNRAMVEMTGVTKDEMLGQSGYAYGVPFYGTPRPILIDLIFRKDQDIEDKYKHVMKKNGFLCAEAQTTLHRKQKIVYLWGIAAPLYDDTGSVVGAIESVRDITDRKQAEEALRASEVRYQTFINSTTDMAYLKDEEFRHLIANKALLNFFRKTEQEVIGKTDYELMPRQAANSCRATDEEARRSGRVVVSEEYIAGKYYETYKFPVSIGADKKGVGGYIRDITYRKRAEDVIQNYQKELRELASQLSLTEEKQRRTIAAELHDGIGQLLSMSKLRLQNALKQESDPAIRPELEDALSMLVQALQDSRSLIFQLSPPILYELGFIPAVEWLVEQFQARHDSIRFCCNTEGLKLDLPLDTRIILFQSTRELLYNIVKHAEAKNAQVSVEQDFNCIRIVVSDDGKGYDMHRTTKDSGFGLFSIHERLIHLGGRLEITGNSGKGTRVVISTPLKAPTEDSADKKNEGGSV